MIFEYLPYYNQLYVIPITFIVVGVLGVINLSYYRIVKQRKGFFFNLKFLILFLIILLSGSIDLKTSMRNENPHNLIQISGEITDIRKVYKPTRLFISNKENNPHVIVVNNEEYYINNIASFSEGDYVVIDVLEQSQIVISIYLTEE